MASRLTAFSKFLITLLILGVLFFAGRYFLNNTQTGQNLKKQGTEATSSSNGQTTTSSGMKDLKQIKNLDFIKNMDFQ